MKNDQLCKTYIIEHLVCLVGRLRHGEPSMVIANELDQIIAGLRYRYLPDFDYRPDYTELLEQIAQDICDTSTNSENEEHRRSSGK